MVRDKRAQWTAEESIFYLIFIVIVGCMFVLIFLLGASSSSDVHSLPEGLERELFVDRFLHSSSCFVVEDLYSGRPGLVFGWDKFSQESLDRCYRLGGESSYLGFRLVLDLGGDKNEIESKNFGGAGFGGSRSYPVLVLKDGVVERGELVVSWSS